MSTKIGLHSLLTKVSDPDNLVERTDILIKEYASYHSPFRPNCGDFMWSPWWQIVDSYYTNLELTPDQSTAYPNFALLQGYALAGGLNEVSDTAYPGSTTHFDISSGYRNPAAEVVAAQQNHVKAYMNSRHLAGDAVDIRTGNNIGYWNHIHDAAIAADACVEPISVQGNYAHAHLDWRTQTGTSNTPSGGNSFPSRSICPAGWDN